MTKILLLGKSGMLGSCFVSSLSGMADFELRAFSHEELDVCDFNKLSEKFAEIKPDLVMNCTAYADVDGAEGNRDLAFRINAEAVGEIAKMCKKSGAIFIHFSTDYVFDGKKAEGYMENDETGPINVYGESKLAGEKLIMRNMERFYLIRTSWLFGENGKNFVDTMVKLGKSALENSTELKVVNDQVGSPTYTNNLVQAVIENFIKPIAAGSLPIFGIYHLTNSGTCSWYEFAGEIFRLRKMAVRLQAICSDEFPRPARRPACSILLNNKLGALRSWQEALANYLK